MERLPKHISSPTHRFSQHAPRIDAAEEKEAPTRSLFSGGSNAAEQLLIQLLTRDNDSYAKKILEKNKSNVVTQVRARDSNGNTALMLALQKGYRDIAILIWEKHSSNIQDQINMPNNDGDTALLIATKGEDEGFVTTLLESGADVNHSNNEELTPLMAAAYLGNHNLLGILLTHDAEPNTQETSVGYTPLMCAACQNNPTTVEILLSFGANIHATNNNGSTPLMIAAQHGHLEVVQLLLERGSNINATNNLGATALMCAAQGGHLEIVRYLLDHGADANLKSENDFTALMFASKNKHREIVRVILDHIQQYT